MAMNKALLRTARGYSARHITRRSFVTENLRKEDVNKGGISESRIRIWWDLESCTAPVYYHAATLIRNMRDGLRRIHHRSGPIEIWAYGDMRSAAPSETLIELHNSGVKLRHLPPGDRLRWHVIAWDMIAWSRQNPPPAVHLLMTWDEYSGDIEYKTALQEAMHQLRDQGYEVISCRPEREYPYYLPLLSSVGVWPWETFLAGPTKSQLDLVSSINFGVTWDEADLP